MVKIIEHSDYNAPTDDINIVKTNGYDNNIKYEKAFRIFGNVWIVPSDIYLPNSLKYSVKINNKEYLKDNKDKSRFLKETTLLFKRIASSKLGEQLLTQLEYVVSTQSLNEDNSLYIDDSNDYSVLIPASIIITGTSEGTYCNFPTENGKSIITIRPDIGIMATNGKGIIITDPAISLAHELIHALHDLYDGKPDTKDKNYIAIEESITFGGKSREKLKKEYYNSTVDSFYKKLKQNIDYINTNIFTTEEAKAIENMYFLSNKGTKEQAEYYITDENRKKLKNLIFDTFTETKIAKELKIEIRDEYFGNSNLILYNVDLLDSKFYSLNKGFIDGANPDTNHKLIPHNKLEFINNPDLTKKLHNCKDRKEKVELSKNIYLKKI